MSKSIYEEAKEDLISLTAKFVIPNVEETDYGCLYDHCHFYNILDEHEEKYLKTVKQALEQAHKQEKLLELYKEINNKRKELITLARYNEWSWKLDIEIKEIQDKIKEKENE